MALVDMLEGIKNCTNWSNTQLISRSKKQTRNFFQDTPLFGVYWGKRVWKSFCPQLAIPWRSIPWHRLRCSHLLRCIQLQASAPIVYCRQKYCACAYSILKFTIRQRKLLPMFQYSIAAGRYSVDILVSDDFSCKRFHWVNRRVTSCKTAANELLNRLTAPAAVTCRWI